MENKVNLSVFQQRVLETFRVFDKFCKDNGIIYYAAYGTLIGAVRHHGFIPWDDDVDVMMTRKEYNKFIAARNTIIDGEYRISCMGDDGYPYNFAKFYSTRGTLQEYEQFRFKTGPWVDIFPMDSCDDSDTKYLELLERFNGTHWAYRKSLAYNPSKAILGELVNGHVLEFFIRLYKKIVYAPFKNKYLNDLKRMEREFLELQGSLYRVIGDLRKNAYNKADFADIIDLPFEDMVIPCPKGYDGVLRVCYGDYMELPPIEKQVSTHNNYFLDLDNNYTFEEIEKDSRTKKHPVMSIRVLWDEIKHKKGF